MGLMMVNDTKTDGVAAPQADPLAAAALAARIGIETLAPFSAPSSEEDRVYRARVEALSFALRDHLDPPDQGEVIKRAAAYERYLLEGFRE